MFAGAMRGCRQPRFCPPSLVGISVVVLLALVATCVDAGDVWMPLGDDLFIPDATNSESFGRRVAMSSDGTRVAAAGKGGSAQLGRVRVFEFDTATKTWSQLGSDILGPPSGQSWPTQLGYALEMSSDGNRLVMTTSDMNGDGFMRVYEYSTVIASWQQVAENVGVTSDRPGYSTAISSDGDIVAQTAIQMSSLTGGRVSVYREASGCPGKCWSKMGTDIMGEVYSHPTLSGLSSQLGHDVALAKVSGGINTYLTRMAVGAANAGGPGSMYEIAGHVKVYDWFPPPTGAWIQVGGAIEGVETKEYSGWSVDLSADGSRVVISAILHGSYYRKGAVRVYEHPSTDRTVDWTQVGDTIVGDDGQSYGSYGDTVRISSDGSIIAISNPQGGSVGMGGSTGFVHVFAFNSSANAWMRVGDKIAGGRGGDGNYDPADRLGSGLAMSANGSLVAVGASGGTVPGGTNWGAGYVRVYKRLCPEDEHVSGNDCVPCSAGSTNPAGDDPGGGDTACSLGASPAPPAQNSSSPGAVSASCSSGGNSRATGGTVTTFGDYTIHNFTSSGTFQVTDSTLTEVELLVVGGGGGGSGGGYSTPEYRAGGGGGGEVVHHASKNVAVQSYTVSIGDGGSGGNAVLGGVGSPSSFGDNPYVVQAGGGGGADCCPGTSGGWSGGSSGNAGGSAWMGCQGVTSGGGGGGAGGPGMDGFNDGSALGCRGGDGGVGIQLNISGTQVYYGGGGGGGTNWGVTMSTGGTGGGGNGTWRQSDVLQSSTPGTPNTGGGGGGGAYYSDSGGSNGGSGVVIVRYKSATCNDQSCATDYYHDGASCVACPTGSNRLPDTANQCLCPASYHRRVDGGVYSCAACAQGTTRPAGDTVPGGDATTCSAGSSSPSSPSSSPSAAPSAQDKKAAAEKTRDAILGDIKDARLKGKAKLLADATIAGVKVQRLTAKLTAADEDTACSTAFTKAGMSSSDGACVATVASSGKRRRLSATAYDVELMFSASTVSDDALTAAANELKANGVEGVTSEASVDPIAELKTVPGVDTSKLQTFETEAAAAVDEAESQTPPPPPPPSPTEAAAAVDEAESQTPPPPPPPSPPPILVQDEDDAATNVRALASALLASALALALLA